jgi:hypothetical protein
MNPPERFDTIILGAGAAGLYAALHAGRRGRRGLVIDHNAEVGAKILISGGGRCNFTNLNASDPTRYLSANPHFARSALARHTQDDFVALVRKHGIAYYEKTLGQLFCEGARSSAKIVRLLLDECSAGGVAVRTSCEIRAVLRSENFSVETSHGVFESQTLVVATGGLSIPKLGASSLAYDIAKQFGVQLIAPRPGLVPLTFGPEDLAWMHPLSGVSIDVVARCGRAAFSEAALFTHRGLSGPAILQISSYWQDDDTVAIDFLPKNAEDALARLKRERPKALTKTGLSDLMPERLAVVLLERLEIGEGAAALGDTKDAALVDIVRALKSFALKPTGTEGYTKAEVTVGGIDTDALSQQTMECRSVPGLFFIGESVDVTGWLGGYNFQWAWSSGWAAGQTI